MSNTKVARGARRLVPLALAATLSAPAFGGSSITLSTLADDNGGINYDAYASFTPTSHWTLGANIGHSTSSAQFSDFSGTTYGLSADLHNESFGVRIGWRNWDDSNNFTSRIASGKIYWRRDALEIALLLDQRDYEVRYSFVPPIPIGNTRPVTRTATFGGDSLGLAVSWYGDVWGGYAQFQDSSYSTRLDNALALINGSGSGTRPRLEAFALSVLTRTNGVTDHELSAGIDRSFSRSGLRLDAWMSKDRISGGDSTGASLGYRYSIMPSVELEATLGGTQSDSFDNQVYGGLSVTIRR